MCDFRCMRGESCQRGNSEEEEKEEDQNDKKESNCWVSFSSP